MSRKSSKKMYFPPVSCPKGKPKSRLALLEALTYPVRSVGGHPVKLFLSIASHKKFKIDRTQLIFSYYKNIKSDTITQNKQVNNIEIDMSCTNSLVSHKVHAERYKSVHNNASLLKTNMKYLNDQ